MPRVAAVLVRARSLLQDRQAVSDRVTALVAEVQCDVSENNAFLEPLAVRDHHEVLAGADAVAAFTDRFGHRQLSGKKGQRRLPRIECLTLRLVKLPRAG